MFICGKIYLRKGDILPAQVFINNDGSVTIETADGYRVMHFTRDEIIELNRNWISKEFQIEEPNDKKGKDH